MEHALFPLLAENRSNLLRVRLQTTDLLDWLLTDRRKALLSAKSLRNLMQILLHHRLFGLRDNRLLSRLLSRLLFLFWDVLLPRTEFWLKGLEILLNTLHLLNQLFLVHTDYWWIFFVLFNRDFRWNWSDRTHAFTVPMAVGFIVEV